MLVIPKKPEISDLNRASPLITGCLFAAMPGHQRGFEPTGKEVWRDNISRVVGHIDGSTSGTTQFDLPGWSADAGNSQDLQEIDDIATLWDFPNGGMSAAVLVKVEDDPQNAGFFGKRTGLGSGNQGWMIQVVNGSNTFRFELSDGSGQSSVDFGSYSPGANADWQLIVCTLDASNKEANCYVDGVLDATGTLSYGADETNNNESIKLFGDDNGANDQIEGKISMAAFWDRELSPQEVQLLARDPFTMWRHHSSDDDFFLGKAVESGGGTYFLAF